ncbi:carboxypeptidase-like regulatory domain-containing protein [Marivirga tractuosa]|uniref:carboxypeptidase-like regulatory domain-containing protein n=1 Tax=Marivirga tractuosa TaxID=1006 RepID=UPI0035CF0FD4
MRTVFTLILFISGTHLICSQSLIEGVVHTSKDFKAIEGVHISNISKEKLTFTSANGEFKINSEIGDTLIISYVGMKSKQLIVKSFDFQFITLKSDIIELEEVKVTNIPENQYKFKRKIVDMGIVEIDSFIPFGVTPGKPKDPIPKLYERETNVLFGANDQFWPTLTIPMSYFTKKYSKKHKAKRGYYELKASKDQQILNNKKFNKEIVSNLTGLKGEKLLRFMSFMNLSNDFITKATDYEIAKKVLDSYKDYFSKLEMD